MLWSIISQINSTEQSSTQQLSTNGSFSGLKPQHLPLCLFALEFAYSIWLGFLRSHPAYNASDLLYSIVRDGVQASKPIMNQEIYFILLF